MKILILGGTQFVGRHIAEMLLARGHSVSVFNRGKTPDELSARVERLRGDRDAGLSGLSALNDSIWDVCVDVSGFTARYVRASAGKLRNRIGHYVFISAVSVYGDRPNGPVDPFDRFSYWVQRAGTAGEILTHSDGSDHVQVVDARDVARLTASRVKAQLLELSI